MCPAAHQPPHPLQKTMSLPWQSASPVPLAPLPKGGWHGEAVTGGFLTAPLITLRRGDPCGRPREGKSAKRRQWRMKQAGFEEVPRLAGTTVPVSRSAQRWAREPLPYAPPRTHCTGRTGSSAPTTLFVGADAYIGPTGPRQGTRALPYKMLGRRAAPLVTDAGRRGRRPLR